MLIVFGFKVRLTTEASLVFFCPTCGGDRAAARRSARRWFTVFWIPVVPLKRVGEVVECETCHTRHDPAVADRPTSADLATVLATAVRVLSAMVVRTGNPSDGAMRAAALSHVTGSIAGYDPETLANDIATIDPALAEQYVGPLDEALEIGGKERMLADLVRICLAGGTVTADQRRVIDHAGRGLGLTPAHVTGIVSSVAAASSTEPDAPDLQP